MKEIVLTWLAERARAHRFELIAMATGLLGMVAGWAVGSWLAVFLFPVLAAGALALRWWLKRRFAAPGLEAPSAPETTAHAGHAGRATPRRMHSGRSDSSQDLIEQMLEQGRFALLLRPQIVGNLNDKQVAEALEELAECMTLTPEGSVLIHTWRASAELDGDAESDEHIVRVEAFYLDRYPVTNADFQLFVEAGGYEQMSLWDPDVWSGVLDFVDRTGDPGPAYWEHGRYPRGKANHPVVGVSWYEASAYSRWVGKRLPTDAEWVKAASWPVGGGKKPLQRKFPWGEAMDHRLANVWGTLVGDTVDVEKFEKGGSVGGVYHLIGNVWEWTHSNFGAWDEAARRIEVNGAMKSLRGGAYDTYFDSQSTCQFQSGDSATARKHNIGFRCALGLCDLASNLAPEYDAGEEAEDFEELHETGALETAV